MLTMARNCPPVASNNLLDAPSNPTIQLCVCLYRPWLQAGGARLPSSLGLLERGMGPSLGQQLLLVPRLRLYLPCPGSQLSTLIPEKCFWKDLRSGRCCLAPGECGEDASPYQGSPLRSDSALGWTEILLGDRWVSREPGLSVSFPCRGSSVWFPG